MQLASVSITSVAVDDFGRRQNALAARCVSSRTAAAAIGGKKIMYDPRNRASATRLSDGRADNSGATAVTICSRPFCCVYQFFVRFIRRGIDPIFVGKCCT